MVRQAFGSWQPLLWLLPLLCIPACRLNIQSVQFGTPWNQRAAASIQAGKHSRSEVLDRLGPPQEVFYTLDQEVFLYTYDRHRGSDLDFIFPSQWLPLPWYVDPFRAFLGFFTPPVVQPQEFSERPLVVAAGATAIARSSNATSANSGATQFLLLSGRKLRNNVLQIVFSRETRKVLSKSLWHASDPDGWSAWWRELTLRDSSS